MAHSGKYFVRLFRKGHEVDFKTFYYRDIAVQFAKRMEYYSVAKYFPNRATSSILYVRLGSKLKRAITFKRIGDKLIRTKHLAR